MKSHKEINYKSIIGLVLGPSIFVLFLFYITPAGMNDQAQAVMACTLWVAIWWITEAIPIPVTSLLPIVIFPLTGALNASSTASSYADNMIFLFLGGFIIAIAMERWNLHKRIAMSIITTVGTNGKKIVLGFMGATAFLSMWISNTATAMMMLPIGIAVIKQLTGFLSKKSDHKENFGKALMLGIAYAASIGGMATLVGTPPNVVFAGVVTKTFAVQVSFVQWLVFGLSISLLLLAICWYYITRLAFPVSNQQIPGGVAHIKEVQMSLGAISPEEKRVLLVFISVAVGWIIRPALLNEFLPALDDAMIAIAGAIALFIIPATPAKTFILSWDDMVKIPWGVILLFGGGLAIAAAFNDSGLSTWIGDQMKLLDNVNYIIIMATVTTTVNFLTEITSNTATASMILPLLASIAESIDVHPFGLMVAASLASSCAFMLPVATPPNAIVFGSGYLTIKDMVKAGIWMNIISIIIVVLAVLLLLPVLWGIDLHHFPENFK